MKEISKEILQRGDVELLVNRFYEKVKSDELLKPIFSQVRLAISLAYYVRLLVFDAARRSYLPG